MALLIGLLDEYCNPKRGWSNLLLQILTKGNYKLLSSFWKHATGFKHICSQTTTSLYLKLDY